VYAVTSAEQYEAERGSARARPAAPPSRSHRAPPLCTDRLKIKPRMRNCKYLQRRGRAVPAGSLALGSNLATDCGGTAILRRPRPAHGRVTIASRRAHHVQHHRPTRPSSSDFDLSSDGFKTTTRCHVVWRHGTTCGVRFVPVLLQRLVPIRPQHLGPLRESGHSAGAPPCRLMALLGPDSPARQCRFLREKRTSELRALTSEFDPTETSESDRSRLLRSLTHAGTFSWLSICVIVLQL
jgi:hypothetical protein